ncbi:MAG: hypothetical protein K0Q51_417 [Rickettsiaceae bacterium]|jgi:hypothetical protein|nr:hypothetical protein [Rickettsiaceae bacterium]
MIDLLELTPPQVLEALKQFSLSAKFQNLEHINSTDIPKIYAEFIGYHNYNYNERKHLKDKMQDRLNQFTELSESEQQIILTLISIELKKYHKLLDFIEATYIKDFANISKANLQEMLFEEGEALKQALDIDNESILTDESNRGGLRQIFSNLYQDLQEKWEPLKDSAHIKNTTGYYGQAWINHSLKQIIIVSAGTKFDYAKQYTKFKGLHWCKDLFKDIINDIYIYFNRVPLQFELGASKFLDSIIEDLKDKVDLSEFNITFSGHSMGGVLAKLLTALSLNKYQETFNQIRAICIDTPGSKEIVEKWIHKYQTEGGILHAGIEEIGKLCLTINNGPNWFNAVGHPLGEVIDISTSNDNCLEQNNIYKILQTIKSNFDRHDKQSFREPMQFKKTDEWEDALFTRDIKYSLDAGFAKVGNAKDAITCKLNHGLLALNNSISSSYLKACDLVCHTKATLAEIPNYTNVLKDNFIDYKEYITDWFHFKPVTVAVIGAQACLEND